MRKNVTACLVVVIGLLVSSAATNSQRSKPKTKEEKSYSAGEVNERIKAALDWLADHQGPEGSWSAKQFSSHSTRAEAKKTYNIDWVAPGKPEGEQGLERNNDIATTSLALLAFCGEGYDFKTGDYSEQVRKGVVYLRKQQMPDGVFGDGTCSHVHDHAVATQAICELYGLSADPILEVMAKRAIENLISTQNDDCGWGSVDGESDTQMTGWCVMAMRSGQIAGVNAEYAKAWEGVHKWLDSVSNEVKGVTRTGYKNAGDSSPRDKSAADWKAHPDMDAVNVICRLFSGDDKWNLENKVLKGQHGLIAKDLPVWENKKVDFAYLYFGYLVMFQFGGTRPEGDAFTKWSTALLSALLDNQRGWHKRDKGTSAATLDEYGSWDAVDAWHASGGRVWSTAMAALTLEIYGRYRRLHRGD